MFDDVASSYITHDYVLDGTKILSETVTDNAYYNNYTLYYVYDANGSITGLHYNNQPYYFQKNIQGDILRILDRTGTAVVEYTYDAWGNIISVTGSMANTLGQYNPFRYRGYYYDSETDLYYLQSRYYDAEVGRFINADGIFDCDVEVLSGNLFLYCANSCINKLDPTGGDAIWLQDTDGVYTAGHTGLLLQDDDGTWYHVYWGNNRNGKKGKSGAGKTILKYSGKLNLKNISDFYKKNYGGTYEKMIYFEGDFSESIEYIYFLMKNTSYNLAFNNCMQTSANALARGTFEKSSFYYKTFLLKICSSYVPNIAYRKLSCFHSAIQQWHSAPWYRKWRMLSPAEAVIIF